MSVQKRMLAVAACLGVAAAGVLTSPSGVAAPAPLKDPGESNVFITESHNVAMNKLLRPGKHKFIVRSAANASFQLLRPADGYSRTEATRSLRRAFRGNNAALRRFENNTTLLGGVDSAPGEPATMWTHVSRGTLWALDAAGPLKATKISEIVVDGRRLRGGGVSATDEIRATGDSEWGKFPRGIQDRGRLRFKNNSDQDHILILAKLRRGEHLSDFRRWVNNDGRGRPPVHFNRGVDTGVLSGGQSMTMKYDIPEGRYILLCFWFDSEHDGIPHVFMGMYRAMRVR